MPQITLKETITRKLDIPLETLVKVIDSLSVADRKKLLSRIERSAPSLQKFKKDKLTAIVTDFAKRICMKRNF
jgi:adenine/guanine phosphoribosyltransferase-like PRPP-binding protein